jgi:hypothetical protein
VRPEPAVRLPVAVLLEKRQVSRGRWTVPNWQAVAVVAGEEVAGATPGRTLARSGENFEHHLWGGLTLELHKDGAEDYWFNLTGGRPALYVLCHESPDGDVQPFAVTANPTEASGSIEAEAKTYAVPIPPEVYKRIEKFVVENYVPQERGKRKRKDWMKELDRG